LMLRRRSRDRRDRKPRETPSATPAPSAKRRARPDAVVPEELKLSGHPGRRNRDADPGSSVVLVTGFDPFGGESTNPSWDICARLPKEIAGLRVEACRLPCEFRRAIEVAAAAIERHHPQIVISIGQAGGRTRIGVERVAINVDD